MYALEHMLEQDEFGIEVDIFERLASPWGLVRNGVAADHPEKKLVVDRQFAYFFRDRRVRFFGAVEIGDAIRHDDLMSWYDAVLYAVGADDDTPLGIAGESLAGCLSAREFVGWYNGHPDFRHIPVDLSHARAVIVGNGNVALDVARVLTVPMARLEATDMADHALEALARSRIEEVVVLGRRGPEHGAFHNPELEELEHLEGVDLVVHAEEVAHIGEIAATTRDFDLRRKLRTIERIAARRPNPGNRRIVLRFLASPSMIEGGDHVEAMVIGHNRMELGPAGAPVARACGTEERLECRSVFRAIGYRGRKFAGLPFDGNRYVIANEAGRVIDGEAVIDGVYVAGWAKRGCRGVIGSNKKCARQSVDHLLADMRSLRLQRRALDKDAAEQRVLDRIPHAVCKRGWALIDRAERNAGRLVDRPRVKMTDRAAMIAFARTASG